MGSCAPSAPPSLPPCPLGVQIPQFVESVALVTVDPDVETEIDISSYVSSRLSATGVAATFAFRLTHAVPRVELSTVFSSKDHQTLPPGLFLRLNGVARACRARKSASASSDARGCQHGGTAVWSRILPPPVTAHLGTSSMKALRGGGSH